MCTTISQYMYLNLFQNAPNAPKRRFFFKVVPTYASVRLPHQFSAQVATGAHGNHIRIPIRLYPLCFLHASAFCLAALSAKKCRLNLFNMLPNYSPADVDAAQGSGGSVVRVADCSPGIPADPKCLCQGNCILEKINFIPLSLVLRFSFSFSWLAN